MGCAEGSAASQAAAGNTSSSSAAATPSKAETRSWADDAEEEEKTQSSSEAQAEDVKKMEALRIKEEGLVEPDDSAIRAVTSGETVYASALSFEDLNLSKELIQGLYVEMGFKRPSKIQAVSLPMILTPPHKNLVAQASSVDPPGSAFQILVRQGQDHRNDEQGRSTEEDATGALHLPHKGVGSTERGSPFEDGKVHWDYFNVCHSY